MDRRTSRDIVARSKKNPLISLSDLPFRVGDVWNAAVVRFQGRYLMLLTVEELEGYYSIYRADSDDEASGPTAAAIDGTADADRRLSGMLHWDVNNGIARRAWAGNDGAVWSAARAMEHEPRMTVTLPAAADGDVVRDALAGEYDD